MIEKIELSPKAEALLMKARPQFKSPVNGVDVWTINRTLGWRTFSTNGDKGARPDVAELYRRGLVKEWWNPWCPPLYLTPDGKRQFSLRLPSTFVSPPALV